jgi:hypothetical protein
MNKVVLLQNENKVWLVYANDTKSPESIQLGFLLY